LLSASFLPSSSFFFSSPFSFCPSDSRKPRPGWRDLRVCDGAEVSDRVCFSLSFFFLLLPFPFFSLFFPRPMSAFTKAPDHNKRREQNSHQSGRCLPFLFPSPPFFSLFFFSNVLNRRLGLEKTAGATPFYDCPWLLHLFPFSLPFPPLLPPLLSSPLSFFRQGLNARNLSSHRRITQTVLRLRFLPPPPPSSFFPFFPPFLFLRKIRDDDGERLEPSKPRGGVGEPWRLRWSPFFSPSLYLLPLFFFFPPPSLIVNY